MEGFAIYKSGSVLEISLQDALSGDHKGVYNVIAQDEDKFFVEYLNVFKNSFAISFLKDVSHELRIYSKQGKNFVAQKIVLPEHSAVSVITEDSIKLEKYLILENFVTPRGLYYLQNDSRLRLLKRANEVYQMDLEVHQNWAQSSDGTRVPYFVVHKKDLVLDGTHPTILNAYGGFAISRLPSYLTSTGKLWLEKGGVYAQANIRGGAEFGTQWHRSAILENKQRSYDDMIAVSEDLISKKYTTPRHLGIRGGSNGGLLVGAVMAQRPDLFNAVLCEVPLLDMIRYVDLPPGASWMDEYGDPKDEKMKEVILKYSPYQNVHADRKYPEVFFNTVITDDRVHPSHARRMAAKMQSQGHSVFFYEESAGGHNRGDLKTKAFLDALRFSYMWLKLS